jgi:hypothetical protein
MKRVGFCGPKYERTSCRECGRVIEPPRNRSDALAQKRGFCRTVCEENFDFAYSFWKKSHNII